MNITLTINELNDRRKDLESSIAKNKEEIKAINLKLRKLDTLVKKAEELFNENGTTESTDDAKGEGMRGEPSE